MKKLLMPFAVGAALFGAVFTGCETTYDPGACYTEGDFDNANVDKAYARMVCMDWTYLLLQNCVEVYGLPLNPTDTEIALYCDDMVDDWSYGVVGFRLEHSCNFIDNPSFECTQYAANQAPLMTASTTERERLTRTIESKARVIKAQESLRMSLEGTRFSLREYLGK